MYIIIKIIIIIVKPAYIDSTSISSRISRLNPSWNGDNSNEVCFVRYIIFFLFYKNKYLCIYNIYKFNLIIPIKYIKY